MVELVGIRVQPTKCPHCGKENDMHTGAQPPSEGCVSICWECQGLSIICADLSVRKPSDQELQSLMQDPAIRLALKATKMASHPIQAAADVAEGHAALEAEAKAKADGKGAS